MYLSIYVHGWERQIRKQRSGPGPLSSSSQVQVPKIVEPVPAVSPARQRIWRARHVLQNIDRVFVELLDEDRGAALRREILKALRLYLRA